MVYRYHYIDVIDLAELHTKTFIWEPLVDFVNVRNDQNIPEDLLNRARKTESQANKTKTK